MCLIMMVVVVVMLLMAVVVVVDGMPGGATPIYKPYRYVPPQRVSFSSISSLK